MLTSWVSDRRLGFFWAHFPLPHPPGMLPSPSRSLQPNYFDNLALVDDAVGMAVAELKRNGRWDDSIVVITSDHGLRREIWQDRPGWTKEEDHLIGIRGKRDYVPVIVHLPRQRQNIVFDQALSAMVLHELILEWSQGRLIQPEALSSWLAARAKREHSEIRSAMLAYGFRQALFAATYSEAKPSGTEQELDDGVTSQSVQGERKDHDITIRVLE